MFRPKRSWRPNILFIVMLSLSVPAMRAEDPDLPAGPVQAKVRTACLECHESRIIIQQRLGKGAWIKEVDKMIKWGAVVDPTDKDAFVEYLSSNFPADRPPEPMDRVRGEKRH